MGGLLGVTKHTQILSWFGDIAEDVGNWLLDWVSNIVGGILWLFCEIFFVILDLFETIFR